MPDEVDRLEIAVDIAAKNANRSLNTLEKKINKIADGLERIIPLTASIENIGNFNTSGFEKAEKKMDEMLKKSRQISRKNISPRVNRSDLKYTSKTLDDIYDKFRDVGRNVDLSDLGLKELEIELRKSEAAAKRLNDRLEKKIATEGTSRLGKSWESLIYDIQKATNQAKMYKEAIDRINSATPKFTINRGNQDSKNIDISNVQKSNMDDASFQKYDSSEIQKYINDFADASIKGDTFESQIKRLKKELSDLSEKGYSQYDPEYDAVARELAEVTEAQKKYNKELREYAKQSIDAGNEKNSFKDIKKSIRSADSILSNFGKKISKVFDSASKQANKLLKSLVGIKKQSNKGMSLGRMLGYSILFSFVFQGISAIQNAIKEGSDNLTQYSAEYNKSISSIVSSLLYLKNAWAAAFAPIVNVVSPYISAFIDMIASALNAIGQFMSALTGKGSAVQAKKVWKDYGASLSDAGKDAKDAKDAMKDLQSYTLGIDELNIIQPTKDSDSGSDKNNGGGLSPSDMFETVTVEGAISDFAKRLRDAAKRGDWYGVGEIIASGLNSGMQKVYDVISWDNVEPRITAFSNAFTTTFNSIVDNLNWDLLGRTIGAGVNTIVNTANLFIEGINWETLGVSFGTGIMGIVDEVNWANLGRLIGNKFMIAWDVFLGLVVTLNWGEVGRSLADGFNGMLQTINLGDIGTTIGTIVAGIIDMFREFFSNADWSEVAKQIKEGILNALSAASSGGKNNGILAILFGVGGAIGISKISGPLLTAINTVKEALAGINFSQVFSGISAPVAGLTAALSFLAVGLGIVFASNEDVRENFSKAASEISENFQPVMEFITKDIIPDLISGWDKLQKILEPFGNFLNTVFTDVWQKFINPALEYLGDTILPRVISTFKNLWKKVLVPLGNLIGDVFTPVIEFVSFVLEKLWKNVVSPLAESLKGPLTHAFDFVYSVLNSTIIPIVNAVIDVFQFLWDNVLSPIVNFLRSTFGPVFETVFDGISTLIDNLGGHFETLIDGINKALDLLKKAINGIIDGINWVSNKLGLGDALGHWEGVQLAKGTNGLPQDTIAMVNDQKGPTYRELILPPSGKPFIPSGRNVTLPLQKGTKVMPAEQTKQLLNMAKIPKFEGGIGDFFSGAWEKVKDIAGNIWDYMTHPDKILQIAINKFVDMTGLFEPWLSIAGGIVNKIFDSAVSFVKGLFNKATPEVNYNPSAGVEQWRSLAAKALQMTGQYSESNLNRLLMQMQSESGGNPNAINNWDINAKRGTPSKGLMQVIDPTFQAYKMPGYDNIWDPLSNMLAAIRYTLSRYGSLANGWKGHGYADGIGRISLSDIYRGIPFLENGGIIDTGQLFVAREKGPELVGSHRGRSFVMNNNQIVRSVSSGVESAMERQNSRLEALMLEIIENQERLIEKENSFNIDGKRMDKGLSKARKNSGYTFITT